MPQSLASVLIHLVFSTKYREPLIQPEIEQELYRYISEVCRSCQSPLLTIGGTEDHLHILFALHRTRTIAEVVEEIKKNSSKWIKTKGESFHNFQWQAGYGAFSIGQSNIEALRRYITTQKEHHRRKSFQDELRRLLQKYEIKYDERYVWD